MTITALSTPHAVPRLPEELYLHIFSYLPPEDLATAACASRAFRRIANTRALWKSFAARLNVRVHKGKLKEQVLFHTFMLSSFVDRFIGNVPGGCDSFHKQQLFKEHIAINKPNYKKVKTADSREALLYLFAGIRIKKFDYVKACVDAINQGHFHMARLIWRKGYNHPAQVSSLFNYYLENGDCHTVKKLLSFNIHRTMLLLSDIIEAALKGHQPLRIIKRLVAMNINISCDALCRSFGNLCSLVDKLELSDLKAKLHTSEELELASLLCQKAGSYIKISSLRMLALHCFENYDLIKIQELFATGIVNFTGLEEEMENTFIANSLIESAMQHKDQLECIKLLYKCDYKISVKNFHCVAKYIEEKIDSNDAAYLKGFEVLIYIASAIEQSDCSKGLKYVDLAPFIKKCMTIQSTELKKALLKLLSLQSFKRYQEILISDALIANQPFSAIELIVQAGYSVEPYHITMAFEGLSKLALEKEGEGKEALIDAMKIAFLLLDRCKIVPLPQWQLILQQWPK